MKNCITIIFCVCLCAGNIGAYTADVDRIPNGSIISCDGCHGAHYSLNLFGIAYENNGQTWNAALASMDSDGDNYSNGTELLDPAGSWVPGNPDPGTPDQVTDPSDASSHPTEATPTPQPTSSPPTPTPTPPGTPPPATPTEDTGDCTETGVRIIMPQPDYLPGDTIFCTAIVCNSEGSALNNYPLFVILEVFGYYYFAPSFNNSYDNYLDTNESFPEGKTEIEVLPAFTWPVGAGSASNIIFYGALTDPSVTDLIGTLGTYTFNWTE